MTMKKNCSVEYINITSTEQVEEEVFEHSFKDEEEDN